MNEFSRLKFGVRITNTVQEKSLVTFLDKGFARFHGPIVYIYVVRT